MSGTLSAIIGRAMLIFERGLGAFPGAITSCPDFSIAPKIFCAAVLASTLGICAAIPRAYAITEREAQDIAVEAYVYFCPPVTMDVTCKQLTNLEPGKVLGRGPMNMFNHVPAYPPADAKFVVRPNFDTPSCRGSGRVSFKAATDPLRLEPVMI